jgi:hypothetical protein
VVIRTSQVEAVKVEDGKNFDAVFDEAIKTAEFIKAPDYIINKLKTMKQGWTYGYSPEESLQVIFDSYGLS